MRVTHPDSSEAGSCLVVGQVGHSVCGQVQVQPFRDGPWEGRATARRHSSWCLVLAQSRRCHPSTPFEQVVVLLRSVGRIPDWVNSFASHQWSCHVEVVLVLAAQVAIRWDLRIQCWPSREQAWAVHLQPSHMCRCTARSNPAAICFVRSAAGSCYAAPSGRLAVAVAVRQDWLVKGGYQLSRLAYARG